MLTGRSGASTAATVTASTSSATGQQRKGGAVPGGVSSPGQKLVSNAAPTASSTPTGNVGKLFVLFLDSFSCI